MKTLTAVCAEKLLQLWRPGWFFASQSDLPIHVETSLAILYGFAFRWILRSQLAPLCGESGEEEWVTGYTL